ncbi:hypothetical protein TNCV_2650101 [Trichonephila clavipes]|nr:hypothetical protein TNCV_2650101 [Trichonephila clavipes]
MAAAQKIDCNAHSGFQTHEEALERYFKFSTTSYFCFPPLLGIFLCTLKLGGDLKEPEVTSTDRKRERQNVVCSKVSKLSVKVAHRWKKFYFS